jgi:hypothetical protein
MIKRWCLVVMSAACFALVSGPAPAQLSAMADKKAIVEDEAVAEILKSTTADREISEAVARRFGPMLFKDGVLSLNERDLMQELLSQDSEPTTITAPSGEVFDVPPLSFQARSFLGLVRPPDISTLWLRGPAQMKQLVDLTILVPDAARQITDFIQQRLNVVWMDSTIANGYGPIRRDLSAAIRMLQQTDAETERQGRSLIYDAARQLDRRNGDEVPNYLYDYLR